MPFRRSVPSLLLIVLGVLAARPAAAAPRPVEMPRSHLTWREPWGDPGAATTITRACSDTSTADTLYLTIEAPPHHLPFVGISGALLFEPMQGDTLDPYWHLEHGDDNSGSLLVDFDFLVRGGSTYPWQTLVTGMVGYTRSAGRGRLDFSADVPRERTLTLYPGQSYLCVRVALRHKARFASGCAKPVRITWVGGRIRSWRPGSESMAFALGPLRSVSANAPRGGVPRRRTGLAVETWVPQYAPPSRATLANRNALLRDPPPPAPGSE